MKLLTAVVMRVVSGWEAFGEEPLGRYGDGKWGGRKMWGGERRATATVRVVKRSRIWGKREGQVVEAGWSCWMVIAEIVQRTASHMSRSRGQVRIQGSDVPPTTVRDVFKWSYCRIYQASRQIVSSIEFMTEFGVDVYIPSPRATSHTKPLALSP